MNELKTDFFQSNGSVDRVCKIGRTKDAVLPLPVLAQPIQSRPVEKKQVIF